MKNQIQSLKKDLKSLASQISYLKSTRKSVPNGYVSGLSEVQYQFRHKHIAYCLLRGRTMEQIENSNRPDNKPNQQFIDWIVESVKTESKAKLYVVVDEKLSKSQQAVQAGHAVAEFLKKHPNTIWKNGTLVYLRGKNMGSVYGYRGYEWAEFKEPDMKDAMTAIAAFGPDLEMRFKSYELV